MFTFFLNSRQNQTNTANTESLGVVRICEGRFINEEEIGGVLDSIWSKIKWETKMILVKLLL